MKHLERNGMTLPIVKWVALLTLLVSLVGFSAAADRPTDRPKTQEPGDPLEAVEKLRAEYARLHNEHLQKIRTLSDTAEREAHWENRPTKSEVWTPRFWKIARAHARTEAAFRALNWIRSHSSGKAEHGEAVSLLFQDHLEHKDLGGICRRYIGAPHPSTDPAAEKVIRKVMAESPHARARAEAGYCLAKVLQHKDAKANRDEVVRLLEQAVNDCKDITGVFPFMDMSLSEVANNDLFELEHLQVGCKAPDIIGADMEETAFKLSDYQGKVVLLDFWGHW